MRSWLDVATRHPDATLAVVGPPGWCRTAGPEARDAEDAVGPLIADDRIVRLGLLSDAELRWCYEQARLVLCPSLLEGFGHHPGRTWFDVAEETVDAVGAGR
jgi:hypothetical protein